MKPCLIINGTDYSDILNEESIQWSRNDLDSDDAGRTLDGIMHRKRVAIKRKLQISELKRLTTEKIAQLNASLMPETIQVQFVDPIVGGVYTGTFYGSSVNATTMFYDEFDDVIYWDNIEFNITEV